ncbi:MAG: signal peptidase I [Tannerellaceae bacterium]|jgi:signal peptidase I|nr:signal peptidase I [Tannerellaceae bacterium]
MPGSRAITTYLSIPLNKGRRAGLIFAGIVCMVLLIRHFCIGSYRISTHAMEKALYRGDYVLANKLFVTKRLKRNDIILFKSPLQRDKDHTPLIVSRCVALPGDTIHVGYAGYTINGVLYPRSPQSLASYTVSREIEESFVTLLAKMNIPVREPQEAGEDPVFILTPFEEYQIREEMNEKANRLFAREKADNYVLVVPQKGETYRLNQGFLTAGREAIRAESAQEVTFPNRRLFIDGKEVTTFTFSKDYYWALSDNTADAIDSRHVGFIPADHITGKVWFRWFNAL